MKKTKVLFLCTGNSARSQMAEALVNRLRGNQWKAVSAGTHPSGSVHPLAVTVMREIGVDISQAHTKSADEFREASLDLVITVCDSAAEECPLWLGQGKRVHIGFPDPAHGTLDDFRAVRDRIRQQVIPFLDAFEQKGKTWLEQKRSRNRE